MRVISAEEQKKVIEMADMIEAVSTALCEYSRSRTVTPVRTVIPISRYSGNALTMPASAEPGTHVNAIGSFRPTMQEIPSEAIVQTDKVVVESREAALEEAGDLTIPVEKGDFNPECIYAELGEIASGTKRGRESDDETTVFKSVGLAAADIVVAKEIYEKAIRAGFGQKVSL